MSGYKLEFISDPVQDVIPWPYRQNKHQKSILSLQVQGLLENGVIQPVDEDMIGFVSNIFLRPKPNGKFRMIIDLSDLNEHLDKVHFKMDHLDQALDLIMPNSYFASIDLRDAYYSVPIWQPHQKYLSFQWEGEYFSFKVLPFGLTSAPRIFTKLLKPVFSTLRERGVSCLGYIDDCLVVADTFSQCQNHVNSMKNLLVQLGFSINEEKSSFVPNRKITFLGYELDSTRMTVSSTQEKVDKTLKKLERVLSTSQLTTREVASLTGTLVDLCKGVQYGLSRYKAIEKDKIKALKRVGFNNFDAKMFLSDRAKIDIRWWINNLRGAKKDIKMSSPKHVLITDASLQGWGAVVKNKSTGGRWSANETELHINVLELKAVLLGLKSFHRNSNNIDILVKSDNTVTVSYINKMGGTHSKQCDEIAGDIWHFCEMRNIWLVATHIPGVENEQADFASRNFTENTEWVLSSQIFHEICVRFGIPSIDLFAPRLNCKVPKFISWGKDPDAWACNAFSLDWSQFDLCYLFPPFN